MRVCIRYMLTSAIQDRQSRTSNIIIHGVAENKADNEESDKNYAKTLFELRELVSGQIPRTDLPKFHLQTRKKKVLF